MNRLDFRAYDPTLKELTTVQEHIEEYGLSEHATYNEHLSSFFERFFGCTIDEYIGMKDKDEKRIYENDIISIDGHGNGRVEWFDSAFFVYWLDDDRANPTPLTEINYKAGGKNVFKVLSNIHGISIV